MEEELGMNLFLGDEFYDEENDNIQDPNEFIKDDFEDIDDEDNNQDDDSKLKDEKHKEEPNEDEDPEDVVGDDTEEEQSDDNKDDNNSSPPLYKSFASLLHQKGIFSSVDSSKLENINDISDLETLINEEVENRKLRDFTDEQREAIEAYKAGFDIETFQNQKKAELELESITEDALVSNEELRRQIIYQDYINQGFKEDKALKLTNRSFEIDEDVNDAKESLENIKNGLKERFEQEKQYRLTQAKEAKEAEEKRLKKLEETILKNEEPLQGIKVNEIARKEILKTMMVPVSKNPITGAEENALMKSQREDPDFAQKLYSVFTLSKGFTDFSYFGKKETKKKIDEFEKVLKNNQHVIQGGDPSFLDDKDSKDYEIGDNLIF